MYISGPRVGPWSPSLKHGTGQVGNCTRVMTSWDHLYNTTRWRRLRAHQLRVEPLCSFCLERGAVTPATIADHVEPHCGDVNKFWLGKLQSLCIHCHTGRKHEVEVRGYFTGHDITGMPLDPRHPAYR